MSPRETEFLTAEVLRTEAVYAWTGGHSHRIIRRTGNVVECLVPLSWGSARKTCWIGLGMIDKVTVTGH